MNELLTADPARPAATQHDPYEPGDGHVAGNRRRRPFKPRVDKVNRVLLGLLGVVSLAAGIVVLLAGEGTLGTDVSSRPTLTASNRSFAADHGWFWPVAGVVAGVAVVLSVWWLLTQLSTARVARLQVADGPMGRTRLSSDALSAAVRDEIEHIDGVRRAKARIVGRTGDPILRLDVHLDTAADLGTVRHAIDRVALPNARRAVERPYLRAEVKLRLTGTGRRRVV